MLHYQAQIKFRKDTVFNTAHRRTSFIDTIMTRAWSSLMKVLLIAPTSFLIQRCTLFSPALLLKSLDVNYSRLVYVVLFSKASPFNSSRILVSLSTSWSACFNRLRCFWPTPLYASSPRVQPTNIILPPASIRWLSDKAVQNKLLSWIAKQVILGAIRWFSVSRLRDNRENLW